MAATSPAFAAITPNDRRGLLWIASILSFVFVFLTFSARMYVRKHMLGRDDYASIVAVVLGVAQYVTVFTGMPLGLGTSEPLAIQGNEAKSGLVCIKTCLTAHSGC
jgi:hypothetical protein